jgi:hypothetical protein
MAMLRQFELQSGETHMVGWIEDDKRLTKGRRIVLQGNSTVWTIVKRYATLLDSMPDVRWKVGGLL